MNAPISKGPGFGFLIPLETADGRILKKTYRVDSDNKGFISGYNAVFGYADLHQDSSDLYFTESGRISITKSAGEEVYGKIDIELKNGHGESMIIKGHFRARPLPPRMSLKV